MVLLVLTGTAPPSHIFPPKERHALWRRPQQVVLQRSERRRACGDWSVLPILAHSAGSLKEVTQAADIAAMLGFGSPSSRLH